MRRVQGRPSCNLLLSDALKSRTSAILPYVNCSEMDALMCSIVLAQAALPLMTLTIEETSDRHLNVC